MKAANGCLVYQCLYCGTIDRKGRLTDSVFRDHVAIENVPFYCRLCKFRSQDRLKLCEHLANYGRHQQAAAKLGPMLNNRELLVKAPSPRFVTEADIIRVPSIQEVAAETESVFLTDWLAEVTPVVTTHCDTL
ncbi:hypothetical protein DPMN_095088 [Dreissena polymorpha]|uniref:Uncharacterized protein n=1 Tax=Dreissena polymorpha TaxID=45954 RepID=A0A9D4L5U7_DREPO|nr:hypothetical protein DPMN_095088 [Dreissena polymorpha]